MRKHINGVPFSFYEPFWSFTSSSPGLMLITFEVDRHDRLRRAEPLPPRDNALMHGADQNVGHFHLQQEMLGRPVTEHFKPAIDCTASTRMDMLAKVLHQGFFKHNCRCMIYVSMATITSSICPLVADHHGLHLQRGDPRPQRGISVKLQN